MKIFFSIRNNSGMSLVGTLGGLALVTILIGALLTVSQNMLQVLRTSEVKAAIQDEIFLAQSIFTNEPNCTANFKGLPISNSKNVFKAHQGKLLLTVAPGSYTLGDKYIFSSQDPHVSSPLVLEEINYHLQPGTSNIMRLGLKFQSRGSILGGSLRERELPLQVWISNGKIEKCSSVLTSSPEEPSSLGRQGRGCASAPPEGPSLSDLKKGLDKICDMQTYPVTDGLKVPANEQKKCSNPFDRSDVCEGIVALAAVETTVKYKDPAFYEPRNSSYKDVTLKNRRGYQNAEECKAQQLFSEGDSVAGSVVLETHVDSGQHHETERSKTMSVFYTCINSRWAN